jgi:GNAT superfamily N-acetyltransferase
MKIREAVRPDLSAIVKMLATDSLGNTREHPDDMKKYEHAFEIIKSDRHQKLVVVENDDNEIVGTFQLTFIQYFSHHGRCVAQVESVRVRDDQRGKGIGEKMFQWAFQHAKENGAQIIQLTSDKRRADAKRFYERIGFVASHEGFKRNL